MSITTTIRSNETLKIGISAWIPDRFIPDIHVQMHVGKHLQTSGFPNLPAGDQPATEAVSEMATSATATARSRASAILQHW